MDPFQQQPPPVGELASTLAPINQVVNANNGTNIATIDSAASTRITPAPAGDGALAESAIVVNNSDSPLSKSSEERVRYSQWDDLGMLYGGSFNLKHRAIPTFSFQGRRRLVPARSRHMRIGSTWQELVRHGVSKDSEARDKTRNPSCRSCSRTWARPTSTGTSPAGTPLKPSCSSAKRLSPTSAQHSGVLTEPGRSHRTKRLRPWE